MRRWPGQRNCEQAPHQQRWVHIPHFNTGTSNWDTFTPSHLHTQTRGTRQLCVYSPMVWHYNCWTAALMPWCYCIVFGLIVVLQSRAREARKSNVHHWDGSLRCRLNSSVDSQHTGLSSRWLVGSRSRFCCSGTFHGLYLWISFPAAACRGPQSLNWDRVGECLSQHPASASPDL